MSTRQVALRRRDQPGQPDQPGVPRQQDQPRVPRRVPRRLASASVWTLAAAIPLAFLGMFFAWPVITLVARGFTTNGHLDLSGFQAVLTAPRTWRLVGLTLGQSVIGTALSVLLGVPTAYVLYRCRWRGQAIVRAVIAIPFVLPTVVVGVAFRSLLVAGGPLGFLHLDQSFAAIIAALVFFNYSVVVRTVGAMWERLDPRSEQAARALGASRWRAWWTVTLPAIAPAIASAAAIVFLFCATAYGVVLILGGINYGTIETEIWVQTTQFLDLQVAAVLSVMQLVVIAAVLMVANRTRSRSERALSMTSARAATHPLRRSDIPALAISVVGALLVVVPLGSLLTHSLRVDGAWTLENYRNLATLGGRGALSVTVWQALGNSLRAALVAMILAVVIGGLVALVVSRRPISRSGRRAVSTLDALFMLPLGVSAVTVGFGFLITLDRPLGMNIDLRTSGLLVPIAQAVVAIPLVVRTIVPVLRAIDPRQRHVAATLGARPSRVFATVDLPVASRCLGLALGFAFAVSLGEFGATSFLARPDSATLPVVVFQLIGRPGEQNYGMALAASVVLAVVTAVCMMIAEGLRDRG